MGTKTSRSREKSDQVVSLYQARNGCKTIAKLLAISPRIARVILIERGEYRPGSIKRISGGPCSRKGDEERKMHTACKRMRSRVIRCLDKKPIKPPRPTAGMSALEGYRWRYYNDPQFKLKEIYRSRMRKIMGNHHQSKRQIELLGCSVKDFKTYIERQFTNGMTWGNHGIGKGKWNLDHIAPCSAFDQTNEEQSRQCWHWTNLRPMWAIKNMKKSDTITGLNNQL